jgi:hypothetical protein
MSRSERRRFHVFAQFIHETFPEAKNIADVAGGVGILSYYLFEFGHTPTIIDCRRTRLTNYYRRRLRKQSLKEGRDIRIKRFVKRVEEIDLSAFDLIVALHPDQATEHAVRDAVKCGKSFAVVPCCVFPIDGVRRTQEGWKDYLSSFAPGVARTTLPMDGANVVLYRKICNSDDART